MNSAEFVSVVLPVRNIECTVSQRVHFALDALGQILRSHCEVVVVDDGSSDQTPDVVQDLARADQRVRLLRHSRPRGIECAGQTGLERARGELIFIEESNSDLRAEDLRQLYQISADPTVLAARAESTARPTSPELMRRLQAWGTNADQSLIRVDLVSTSRLQMIRRPHLKKLRSPQGDHYRLLSESAVNTISQ